ncbi:MAG: histidine phosphatase family protein [Thermoplasmata archaeon]|nr:histidine phosphatase family protein [Thermoplasmata archaeon]MCI4353825.1 histidine phosphatase family protein [Thermoplasmata archaeon]
MELILLRHGPAEVRDPARWPDDARRPLTAAGKSSVRAVAKGLADAGVKRPSIRTSPATRCADTARLVGEVVGATGAIERWEELAFGTAPEGVLRRLTQEGPRTGTVVLVGHEPGLGQLAGLLLFGEPMAPIRLKRGGATKIDVPRRVGPSAGRMAWALTRGQLVALGRASA